MRQQIPELEEKSLTERIAEFSNLDAYNFLIIEARNKEFELSQEEVFSLLDKSLAYISEEGVSDDKVLDLIHFVTHETWTFEEGKEFLIERIWRALPHMVEKYPEAVDMLENFVGQQYFVRPEVFLDVAADAYVNKKIDGSFRDRILHSFNYQFTFGSKRYDQALARSLDFENKDNFGRTGKFLDFYRHAFAVSQGEGYSERRSGDFIQILRNAVDSKSGSYLLNLRAKGLLEDMGHSEDGFINRGYDKLPFLLTSDLVAIKSGDDVVVIPNSAEIHRLKEDILDVENRTVPSQEEIDAAVLAGQKFVEFNPPQELVDERRGLCRELKNRIDQGIKLEELDILRGKNFSDIYDYEFLLNPDTRNTIKADFGFELSDLSVSEQFEFLNFLKIKDAKSIPPIQDFTKRFGTDGMRLFMLRSVAGKGFGDEIVSVVERVGDENAQAIVSKCAQILGEINYFDEAVHRPDEFKNKSKISNPEVVDKVRAKILDKVLALFSAFKDKDDADRLIKNLENISIEAVLMQSVVMATRESGDVALNDLPDIDLYTGAGNTITPEQIAKIKEIYTANYATRPGMLKELLADLDVSIGKENTEFHTLYFKGELVGVVVFEYNGEQVYFGKFNIDPKFQGGQIGEQLMAETLDRISKNHIVSATCSKGAPVTPKYIERGFVAEGEFTFEEDECLHIVRNDSMNSIFRSKTMSPEEILRHTHLNNWETFNEGGCQVLMTDYKNMNHLKLPVLAEVNDNKWVITRFFKHAQSNGEIVAVIVVERVSKVMFDKFKTNVGDNAASSNEIPLAA